MVKRRDLVAGMASLPFVSFSLAAFAQSAPVPLEGDTIATAQGNLVIHPVDHASLLLGWADQVIYVDPVGGAALYEGLPAPTAILITHGHGDHFDIPTLEAIAIGGIPILTSQEVFDQLPEALKANATALANGDEGVLNALPVAAIPAHNTTADRMNYHPVGVGNGYLIKFADRIVYVAGDTEPTPEMLALENIDVAFIPMNLPYTMSVEQAIEAVNAFKPKVVYPYHYSGSDLVAFEAGIEDGVEVRFRNWYPNGG